MFHPLEHPMERGWVGRLDGEHVIHLAAQTLQAFFTGGGTAREHAVYPLAAVRLLAPVLHPPSIRAFASAEAFEFANPAAVVPPGGVVEAGSHELAVAPRLAAVIGADGEIGGLTAFADWRRPGLRPPKDRDFAFGLGPVVVTLDELDGTSTDVRVRLDGHERLHRALAAFDWEDARSLAAAGTTLYPGDLLAGPSVEPLAVGGAESVEIELGPVGVLPATVARG
jgi:hypothetical protein